ncbi:MAG: hypothetical protein IT326_01640 [Anaerolineae bacterium]|nr:hypothetical protein [Anaerolineae bacterium]
MFDEKALLDNAYTAWMRHHRMTYSLLDQLTDDQLYGAVSAPLLSNFARHYEEMASVQGAYAEALHTGKLDFSRLPRDHEYSGSLPRAQMRAAMEAADKLVDTGIAACPPDRVIDIFGNRCSRVDLVQTLLHHELFHHGMFSTFCFENKITMPQDWRDFWWIPEYGKM